MVAKYLLVSEPTGITAEELGRRVGMRAFDTPLGTMLEQPKPFDMYGALAKLDRALNPNRCRCTGVLHRADCPAGGGIT
ncbi:MAG: hypothetical protein KGL39_53910 [Patescibacteria group bacterium]|nr:hypothetical protein [Patescibacteria group bacterium]